MNITERTNKDELISSACECIDSLQHENNEMRQERRVLFTTMFLISLGWFF